MIGSIVTTVAAARMVSGVIAAAAPRSLAAAALPLCCMTEESSFISSYCSVVYSVFILLYSIASNQEFHCPTATNNTTVAYTGLHKGEIILTNIVIYHKIFPTKSKFFRGKA